MQMLLVPQFGQKWSKSLYFLSLPETNNREKLNSERLFHFQQMGHFIRSRCFSPPTEYRHTTSQWDGL